MSEERGGMTIKQMRDFIVSLPKEFDEYFVVNGEVAAVQGQFYVRVDKPVVQLSVDEDSGELLILHQTEDEINDITSNLSDDNS
jgi:hypothetical protein